MKHERDHGEAQCRKQDALMCVERTTVERHEPNLLCSLIPARVRGQS